jgi:hypothetical protein
MSNHFHILLAVPRRPEDLPSDEELLADLDLLYNSATSATIRERLERFRRQGHHKAAEQLRQQFFARMWDISAYMKQLKQEFSQWFNRTHGRRGVLWESRFKSSLIDGNGQALAAVAAYIDLNPVRAGIVKDPANYRWCSYAQAMAGVRLARLGLSRVVGAALHLPPERIDEDQWIPLYRRWLYGQGEQNEGTTPDGRPLRLGFTPEEVAQVIAAKGRVPLAQYLMVRVRYFTDGAVLGSREFVNEIFEDSRWRYGAKRQDGARRMRGVDSDQLYAMRDLQLNVFTAPTNAPPTPSG